MPKSITVRILVKDHSKLDRYAKKHDIPFIDAFSIATNHLEVNPLKSELIDKMICCECEVEIPNNCKFCPECGTEFELDKDDMPILANLDEDEDESEDEDEDEDEEEEVE